MVSFQDTQHSLYFGLLGFMFFVNIGILHDDEGIKDHMVCNQKYIGYLYF